jgi:hypothetical protein
MAYKPVTRMITIEFWPQNGPRSRQQIVVTPEYAEVRPGDTIVWRVQGAPKAADVSVGHIAYYGEPVRLSFSKGRAVIGRPSLLRDSLLKQKGKDWTANTRGCELGHYKYDVVINGKTVLDPEVEIKGLNRG